jgi:hypothetical protein
MSKLMCPLGHAAVSAGACLLSLLAVAKAEPAGNPAAVHKRHLQEPYFGHLTGPAEAWVNGRCDGTYQSQFPPCISASWARTPYYHAPWHRRPAFNDE